MQETTKPQNKVQHDIFYNYYDIFNMLNLYNNLKYSFKPKAVEPIYEVIIEAIKYYSTLDIAIVQVSPAQIDKIYNKIKEELYLLKPFYIRLAMIIMFKFKTLNLEHLQLKKLMLADITVEILELIYLENILQNTISPD
jgi:hypothetical protein